MTDSPPPVPPPVNPQVGATWFDDANEMQVWNGVSWVPYEDLPEWPDGDDPDPKALYRDG